jgi:transglutaminase-like putative cysteine protease
MRSASEGLRRLAWTVAGLAAAVAPHVTHLQPWVTALAASVATWRLIAEHRGWRLPGRWIRATVAVAATVAIALSYRALTGLDAGTALLVLMASLKLLETRTPRDHVVLVFIGWFLCLATFLYRQDIPSVAWVLPAAWLLAASLLNVSRSGTSRERLRPFRHTGSMLLKALLLAAVMFVFFPRVAGQFWGAPSRERAITGLSEEVSPGDISELTLNDTVAFRVRFEGDPPPPAERYWRGPVLTEFDGFTWSRARAQAYFKPPVEPLGPPLAYTVTLEPTGQRMLFALDLVADWPAAMASQSWDYQLWTPRPVDAVIQYRAESYTRYRAGAELSAALRNRHLQLPGDRNPRSRELARQMRAAAASDEAFIGDVLQKFRDEAFYYTLTPPKLERDSVDDFLFNTQRGFCGHFASSFTALMRAAGLPARVVAGYQGGDWNPVGNYLAVRQSHAHAWSEVWLAGRGWTRVDPTAAVAPERVESGLDAAMGEDEPVPGRLVRRSELLWQAQLLWDNVNARWNDWIVRYSGEQQERLLEELGFERPDWRQLGFLLGAGLALGLAILSAWLAWEFRPRRQDPATRDYRRFLARLAARGIECAPWEAPRDFLGRVRALRPDLAGPATDITECYLRLRYAPSVAPGEARRLHALVRAFDA